MFGWRFRSAALSCLGLLVFLPNGAVHPSPQEVGRQAASTSPAGLPPEVALRLRRLEERIDRLRAQALQKADRPAQDATLAEAIRLAEEAVAIRRKHQGTASVVGADVTAEWYELADARWVLRTLNLIVAMNEEKRAGVRRLTELNAEAGSLYRQGRHEQSERLVQEMVELCRRIFRGDHPLVARGLLGLAQFHRSRDDVKGAEKLLREALAIQRRLFPRGHPLFATSLHELGDLLRTRGDLQAAERLQRQALTMRRRLFRGDHPHVATSLNNLASLLKDLGDVEEAERLYREALAMQRRLCRGDHPLVATAISNLGLVLLERKDLEGAEKLLGEALTMRRRLFRGDHPDVAQSLHNWAAVRSARGDLEGAERAYRESLEMLRRVFPGGHPDIVVFLRNLGDSRRDRGDLEGAEQFYREALRIARRLFQGDHPAVATRLSNLANLLHTRGKLQESERFLREALAMRRRLSPGDSSHVAMSLVGLALVLNAQGNVESAETLAREALEMSRRLFPGDHADIVQSLNVLAEVLLARGNHEGAEPLVEEALAMSRRLFPGDNRTVVQSLHNWAGVLHARGDLEGAERLQRDVLAMNRRLFPGDHTAVAVSLNNLGGLLGARGNLEDAESLLRQASEMWRRLFPGDHPDVALSFRNLAGVLFRDHKDLEVAERLLREALAMNRRLFPGDHPRVVMNLNGLGVVLRARGDLKAAEPSLRAALAMAESLRPRIVGEERARASFAEELRLPVIAARYSAVLIGLGRPNEAFSVAERGRARAVLDLLERRSVDLLGAARTRAAGDAAALQRLELALVRERNAQIDLTSAEALVEGIQRERALTRRLDAADRNQRIAILEKKLVDALASVKKRRRALADAGAAVLVELRGLHPEAQPFSCGEVLVALDQRELVLSYSWPVDSECVVLSTAGGGNAGGFLLADGDEEVAKLDDLARSVRGSIAHGPAKAVDIAAARKLLAALLPPAVRKQALQAERLVVISDGPLTDLPLELLLAFAVDERLREKSVVHAASATVYVRQRRRREATVPDARGRTAVVLGDPIYERAPLPAPAHPPEGVLVAAVRSGGNADQAGLSRGDVIVEYNQRKTANTSEFDEALAATERNGQPGKRVELRYWRRGEVKSTSVRPGVLGVQITPGDPASALRSLARAQRGEANLVAEGSATDQVRLFGGRLEALRWTRVEALAIEDVMRRKQVPAKLLLRDDATIGKLAEFAPGRSHLHLATHGLMGSADRPYDASLALTRPRAMTAGDIGFLRLEDLIAQWQDKLEDCELVVLSACNTQRGETTGGSVLSLPLGFFFAGARTVVASLWHVDDVATSLLMVRFYENLLGSFEEPRRVGRRTYRAGEPFAPEPALREARMWLRSLTAEDAGKARARLESVVKRRQKEIALPSGSAGDALRGPGGRAVARRADESPYAHPYYWAAFILIGDPD